MNTTLCQASTASTIEYTNKTNMGTSSMRYVQISTGLEREHVSVCLDSCCAYTNTRTNTHQCGPTRHLQHVERGNMDHMRPYGSAQHGRRAGCGGTRVNLPGIVTASRCPRSSVQLRCRTVVARKRDAISMQSQPPIDNDANCSTRQHCAVCNGQSTIASWFSECGMNKRTNAQKQECR